MRKSMTKLRVILIVKSFIIVLMHMPGRKVLPESRKTAVAPGPTRNGGFYN